MTTTFQPCTTCHAVIPSELLASHIALCGKKNSFPAASMMMTGGHVFPTYIQVLTPRKKKKRKLAKHCGGVDALLRGALAVEEEEYESEPEAFLAVEQNALLSDKIVRDRYQDAHLQQGLYKTSGDAARRQDPLNLRKPLVDNTNVLDLLATTAAAMSFQYGGKDSASQYASRAQSRVGEDDLKALSRQIQDSRADRLSLASQTFAQLLGGSPDIVRDFQQLVVSYNKNDVQVHSWNIHTNIRISAETARKLNFLAFKDAKIIDQHQVDADPLLHQPPPAPLPP